MAKRQAARVVSNGLPHGTQVFDAEGQEIKGIVSLTFTIDARQDMGVLTLSFLCPSVEVVGEVVVS